MSNLIILLLSFRPFISEQVNIKAGICFDTALCFCLFIFYLFSKNKKINLFLILLPFIFSLSVFILNFLSVNLYSSQKEVLKFFVFSFLFVFIVLQDRKTVDKLIFAVILVSMIVSIRALYQYFSGFSYMQKHFSRAEITQGGFYAWELLKQHRVVSWFSSPGLLASYLVIICPVVFSYILKSFQEHKPKKVFVFSLIFILLFAALLVTKAIGAYLSLILGLIFLALFLFFQKKKIIFHKGILCILALLLLVSGIAFTRRADYFLNFKNPQNSITQRLYYWKTATAMIREHPVAGIGIGNFGIIYPQFKYAQANETIYAHNIFLHLWAETGIFPLFFLVIFIVYIFKKTLTQQTDIVKIGFLSGSFAFLLHNLIDYSFFIAQVAHLWWIITGCMLVSGKDDSRPRRNKFDYNIINLKFVFCGLVLFLLSNICIEYVVEKKIDKALSFYEKGQYGQAINYVKESLRFRPNNDGAYYFLAHIHRKHNQNNFSDFVVDNYKKAISFNRQYSFYYHELGRYYLEHQMPKQAEEFLRLAVNLYPTNQIFAKSLSELPSQE